MTDLFTLYARYDGPLPRLPPPPPRLDGLIASTAALVRCYRRRGLGETLDAYAHKLNHLVRLEKARQTGQNKES
ncbi:MAG: hypothetical protein H6868_04700 [Rhodospirillales bacterium]|nr:hypothetical protein [Rhodospirillales bacterium]